MNIVMPQQLGAKSLIIFITYLTYIHMGFHIKFSIKMSAPESRWRVLVQVELFKKLQNA